MPGSLENRTVLVIGRGSGIARAIVLAVREAGAQAVIAGLDKDDLAAAFADPGVSAETVDLTDEASVAALAERLGTVDHIVSTASARARGAIGELEHSTVLRSFNVKVIGPMMLAKHFAAKMPRDGSFVFFSGSSALKPAIGMLAVGATNGAVDVVTRSLAVELAPIRVNAVSPGTIDTGAYDGLGEQRKDELFAQRRSHSPARRIGSSEDIAQAVVFELTNTFMTGISLGIDGGEPLV